MYGAICGSGLLLAAGTAAQTSTWRADEVARIVALSDVHGAYAPMVRTLQSAGVIDESLAWSGGGTHLVIVGDLLDRGPDSREAMDLLMRLEEEAGVAGGQVHVLIGNHEAMNLTGDLRYVSAAEYAAFADDETEDERERAFAAWAERRPGAVEPDRRTEFDKRFPNGYFAHRRAFAADGTYGKWLLAKPVIVVLNGTAFVHGGLSPMLARYGLDGVNGKLVGELAGYVRAHDVLQEAGVLLPTDGPANYAERLDDARRNPALGASVDAALRGLERYAESDLHAPDGPLWYRGNVYCGELVEQDRLRDVLASIGAGRVVIGHTPTPNRQVLKRIDNLVLEVDTGMLGSYYGGRGHALVLEGDTVRVVSEAGNESLAVGEHPRRVGARPAGVAASADLESLLQSGELGAPVTDAAGRRVVTVTSGANAVQAVFEASKSRGNVPAVAAYRLDRLLELDMVPVTVLREVDGKRGSLQFLPADAIDEDQRIANGQGGGAYCALPDQWGAMYAFDALIYNEGRDRRHMLYSPDNWQLMLVGHAETFAARKGRPRYLAQAPIVIGDAWQEALSLLDEATIEKEFGDVLDACRRDALLARRDELLETR